MNEETDSHGVAEVLRQGEMLLRALDDAAYTTRVPGAFNASVGGHYRHCLDHFQSLLDALDADEVNYDHRKRDPRIETDREFAVRGDAAHFPRLRIDSRGMAGAPGPGAQQGELRRRGGAGDAVDLRARADVCGRARDPSLRAHRRDVRDARRAAARGFRRGAIDAQASGRRSAQAAARGRALTPDDYGCRDGAASRRALCADLPLRGCGGVERGGPGRGRNDARGKLGFAACFFGIWLGDLWLYGMARAFGAPFVARFEVRTAMQRSQAWFEKRGSLVLVVSRFVPGLRLPSYLAAGAMRFPLRSFMLVTGVAAAVWVTAIFVGGHFLGVGEDAVSPRSRDLAGGRAPWRARRPRGCSSGSAGVPPATNFPGVARNHAR